MSQAVEIHPEKQKEGARSERAGNTWVKPFKVLYRGWMKIAHAIGKVNTLLLLTIFYFLILGIAKLIVLILRKDLLGLRQKGSSYWKERKDFTLDRNAYLKPY